MKRLLLAFGVAATVFTACDNTPKYAINGTVKNLEAKKVFLKEFQGRKAVVIDSADVVDGKFLMEGTVDKTKSCGLFTSKNPRQRPFLGIYLENVPFTVNFDAKDPMATTVKGGATQEVANKFNAIDIEMAKAAKPLEDKYQAMMKNKANMKEAELKAEIGKLREEYGKLQEKAGKEKMALIKANLSSIVSVPVFAKAFNTMKLNEAKEMVNSFTGEAAATETIKQLKERIVKMEKVAIGQPAPDFTMNTIDGKPLSLSSFKGKVLLVDFWASWCGPCRGENPHVVKVYKKYHRKGLEILGVSLDQDKKAWEKAIKDDGLIWNHVSDLKGWQNAAAQLYAVSGIPHTVLINKDGIIVAKNLRGDALEAKVKEILK